MHRGDHAGRRRDSWGAGSCLDRDESDIPAGGGHGRRTLCAGPPLLPHIRTLAVLLSGLRERVYLLLPNPTVFPQCSLSACIHRRSFSPPVQRHAGSSTPCAPARHRRPAPLLLERPRPQARLLPHPERTRAAPSSRKRQSAGPCPCIRCGAGATACPCHHALPRQPAKQASAPPPSLREHLRPPSSTARPRPFVRSADATDASTLAAGWARPPPGAKRFTFALHRPIQKRRQYPCARVRRTGPPERIW